MDSEGRKIIVCDNGTGVSKKAYMFYDIAYVKIKRVLTNTEISFVHQVR